MKISHAGSPIKAFLVLSCIAAVSGIVSAGKNVAVCLERSSDCSGSAWAGLDSCLAFLGCGHAAQAVEGMKLII